MGKDEKRQEKYRNSENANKDLRTEKYILKFKICLLERADWMMQKKVCEPEDRSIEKYPNGNKLRKH